MADGPAMLTDARYMAMGDGERWMGMIGLWPACRRTGHVTGGVRSFIFSVGEERSALSDLYEYTLFNFG